MDASYKGSLRDSTPEELSFFNSLDSRLREPTTCRDFRTGKTFNYLDFTKTPLSPVEATQLLQIVQECRDLLIVPVNTNWGFSVGYEVLRVISPYPGAIDVEKLTAFVDRQLPAGVDWNFISNLFNSPEHISRIQHVDLPSGYLDGFTGDRFESRDHYVY